MTDEIVEQRPMRRLRRIQVDPSSPTMVDCKACSRRSKRSQDKPPGPDEIRKKGRLRKGSLNEERRRWLTEVAGVPDRFSGQQEACARRKQRQAFGDHVAMLKDWVCKHGGSMPWRRDDSEEERVLAGFLAEQRRVCRQDRLPAERRQQLLLVPGMDKRLQQWGAINVPFSVRVDQLEAWVKLQGDRLPKQKSADQEEAKLARFLNKLQRGWSRLLADRQERLEQIPGMSERLHRWSHCRKRTFEERVAALKLWVAEHGGQLPKRDGADADAHRLGKFLSYHQQAYAQGFMSSERCSLLVEVPGVAACMALWDGGPSETEESFDDSSEA